MNTNAAVAIQFMGGVVAVLSGIFGLSTEHHVLCAAGMAFGLAAIFSESGRYRWWKK